MLEEDRRESSRVIPDTGKWRGTLIALVMVAMATVGYAWHERSVAANLSSQNDRMVSTLKETQAQMDALTAKINALAAQAQPASAPEPRALPPQPAKRASAHRTHRDDPRWKKFQAQLDEQNKAIDSTRQDLAGARTELSGSIARTHSELVVLQKKGERNYYEFDIDKSKEYWRKGPIAVRLKKVNTKHQYADVEMIVDDAQLQQKHVNLYQPVIFYTDEGRRPLELVINSVRKNHVHGYVSEPKYKQTELAEIAAGADSPAHAGSDSAAADTATAPKPRRKLEVPR